MNEKSNTTETAIDTNRVLCTGFRVYLELAQEGVLETKHLVDMPFIPRKGDLIGVEDMIDESNYEEQDLKIIYNLSWSVWYVYYGKDKDGYYIKIVCEGE